MEGYRVVVTHKGGWLALPVHWVWDPCKVAFLSGFDRSYNPFPARNPRLTAEKAS